MRLKLKQTKEKQRTIKTPFAFKGFSLFSGQDIEMTCEPSKKDSGIVFSYKGQDIPAVAENVKPMDVHTTALTKNGVDVVTIEHLMAAIWGLGIDNLKIVLGDSVIPAQDGSAEAFTKELQKSGVVEQTKKRRVVEVEENFTILQPEFENRFAKFEPSSSLEIESSAPFPTPIGEHTVTFDGNPETFVSEISWARTFLRSPIDLENLTKWDGIRSVFKALPKDPRKSPIITFTEKEFLTKLKKNDEPARHKMLDLIGDLALIGYRINAKLTINEPGHKFTHLIATEIRNALKLKSERVSLKAGLQLGTYR